jgi:hypothetical protein
MIDLQFQHYRYSGAWYTGEPKATIIPRTVGGTVWLSEKIILLANLTNLSPCP